MTAVRFITDSCPDSNPSMGNAAEPVVTARPAPAADQVAVPRPNSEPATQGPRTGRTRFSSLTRSATAVALRAVSRVERSSGWNFDWDDNIFNMPTQIRLFHKSTGEEIGVSTAEFALIREQIGKPGRFANYEMRANSLSAFADDPAGRRNYFVEDVERAMTTSPTAWQGPSWKAFVRACSRAETAKHTTIITARLHSPATIRAGLERLQALGIIKHVPPLANIYPVNYPPLAAELGGTAANPSAAKAIVMAKILDGLQASPLDQHAAPVTTPDGAGQRVMHLWGFSDDDYGNFDKARQALCEGVRAGRWPDVKIVIFFTGTNHAGQAPRAEVILQDGTTRPARPEEAVLVRRRN